eukprot:gnl/MRDRNA2_/MRDRNA2_59560_c0_seq1.p1 gnl/MRDRNA2_/MRDRNA2_59560_c0~~gnl/MRDRNA2_/MRDRNA2_59560_c0_seq1.p1  ORF type:complete len:1333 (+),score=356.11 gnl/MRDRNA2_/MRDRNA2_59560_c0_seq1:239-4237(+)
MVKLPFKSPLKVFRRSKEAQEPVGDGGVSVPPSQPMSQTNSPRGGDSARTGEGSGGASPGASPRAQGGSPRASNAGSPRSGSPRGSRTGSPRSPRSGSPRNWFSRRAQRRPRTNVTHLVKSKEKKSRLKKLREKLPAALQKKTEEAEEDEEESDADDEDLKDVVEELCLSVEPVVLELGDKQFLARRAAGELNAEDEKTIRQLKKRKAILGKSLFEAENANNLGVDTYRLGDFVYAKKFFEKALELASKSFPEAAGEIKTLKAFITTQYNEDEHAFFDALTHELGRSTLARKKFISQLKGLKYPGDAEHVFNLLDCVADDRDGKITLDELRKLLRAKHTVVQEMDREPAERGVILGNIGAVMIQEGEAAQGLAKLREASQILEHVLPKPVQHQMEYLFVLSNIAVGYIRRGDLDAALDYLSRLLEYREKTFGKLDPDVLLTLYNIGFTFLVKANTFDVLYDCQRQDEKITEKPIELNYNLALCAFKKRLQRQYANLRDLERSEDASADQCKLDIAESHEIIAEIYDKLGNLALSMEHLEQAVDAKEGVLDALDPEYITPVNLLATVYLKNGYFDLALTQMEKAAEASSEIFGEDSETFATVVFHMGITLFKLKRYDEAREKLERAQELQENLVGEDSPQVAATMHQLGNVAMAIGNHKEARVIYENTLAMRVDLLGKMQTGTASTAHALGCVYTRMPRRLDDAIILLKKAVQVRETKVGQESIHLADSLHELGSAYIKRNIGNDADEGLGMLTRAAQIRGAFFGKQSLQYAASIHQIGNGYRSLGEFEEAKNYYEAAMSLRMKKLPPNSAQIAQSQFCLGTALYSLGQFGPALKNLKKSFKTRESLFTTEHVKSADSVHEIGAVYVKKGEYDAALVFLLGALATRKKLNQKECEEMDAASEEEVPFLDELPLSERQKRIRKRRKEREKEIQKKEKQRQAELKKQAMEKAREKARKRLEKKKMREAQKAEADAAMGIKKKRDIFGFLKKKKADDGEEEEEVSGSDSEEDEEGEDGEKNKENEEKEKNEDEENGQEKENEVHKDDEDSEIDIDDMGIDKRGSLAGTIADSLHLIGEVYMEKEDFELSMKYLQDATCLREEVFGTISAQVGETLHAIGLLHERKESTVTALRYFRKALHTKEKACGHNSVDTAATCIEMGQLLSDLGQADEANLYLLRGCYIREMTFGENDPVARRIREQKGELDAAASRFDPFSAGEVIPHFAKRSAESFLHGYKQRHFEEDDAGHVSKKKAAKRDDNTDAAGALRQMSSPMARKSVVASPRSGVSGSPLTGRDRRSARSVRTLGSTSGSASPGRGSLASPGRGSLLSSASPGR